MSDELVLLDAHSAFILGHHQLALKTLQKLKLDSSDTKIRVLLYKLYIAQKKYGVVLDEIPEDTIIPEFRLLRLLVKYLSKMESRQSTLEELELMFKQSSEFSQDAVIIAVTIYLNMDMDEAAWRLLHGSNDTYCNALTVQCLLHMNRCDLAGKIVRRMQTADEDSLAVQLASALYYVKKGGDQLQEAIHIYDELKEKHGPSTLLLNCQAAALMGMNNWVEAEPILQEAIDMDGNNPDTIVNMIVVYRHLGKSTEVINRLISQLRDCYKDHPFLVEYTEKDDEFTRCAKHYAPSVPS
ncbi:Coatomer subunit epsilon [Schistosoma japonicum]|uniref:Coatomer subunit epsilon n=1 Tax=Schistosoma japonicum TaxID=6182 RepID=Q5DEQ9_SCHJA|nr:SJCHGC01641 protein [Schistosoma japonicum]KAH8876493.1 Coatomer subunit epsilon [Schistosoma japonicum]TNN09577.1 Coatomer subunit epsilon [Schistosoma japonicum]CAX74435.1 Coatomer subunit epsilon [Schistosoma japonicum]